MFESFFSNVPVFEPSPSTCLVTLCLFVCGIVIGLLARARYIADLRLVNEELLADVEELAELNGQLALRIAELSPVSIFPILEACPGAADVTTAGPSENISTLPISYIENRLHLESFPAKYADILKLHSPISAAHTSQ